MTYAIAMVLWPMGRVALAGPIPTWQKPSSVNTISNSHSLKPVMIIKNVILGPLSMLIYSMYL
jgi:hypothetical protein